MKAFRTGRRRAGAAALAVLSVMGAGVVSCGPIDTTPKDVYAIANNVSGTISFIDATTYRNLGSLNIIPDIQTRLDEINRDLIKAIAYPIQKGLQKLKVREPGQGDAAGNRFADDLMFSPDGKTVYVSRSNLGDVVAFDLTTASHPMKWRFVNQGLRSDHAQLSPDGKKIVVSSTTAKVAEIINTADGKKLGEFATGDFPHQNDFSADGSKIYNASIGNVVTTSFADNANKGPRLLTVADANTYQIQRTYSFEFGIRPAVFADNDQTMYVQLSYLNGLAKFNMVTGQIDKTVTLPFSAIKSQYYPNEDQYPHDSAWHGLALSGDKTKLCAAGTIDDYVAFLNVADLSTRTVTSAPGAALPYWAIASADGTKCIVSNAGSADVSVYDFNTGTEVARTKAGLYPGRARSTKVVAEALKYLDTTKPG